MRLLIPISLNILLVIAIYLAEKRTKFSSLPYIARQLIIGVLFGGLSCFASSYGVEVMGTVANIRDAAPLSAGLIFGAPSGIIAGVAGGVYRWFSVFWGAGEYTRIACSVATILAGIMAALLRKFMFDNKKPTWSYAIAITVLCEVVHMLLIFITNMTDSSHAFEFVKGATIPMIIGNVAAVGISFVVVSILSKESIKRKKRNEHIAETFQRWLLLCIVIAYFVTSIFTYVLQDGMVSAESQKIFTTAIEDVKEDVRGKSDARLLAIAEDVKEEYEKDPTVPLTSIADQSEIVEINVVNNSGIIINSTVEAHVEDGFNMYSTEQSAEFMVLTRGEQSYVQEYGAMGRDGSIMRKYAGVALDGGGFIQVGYSTEQFYGILNDFVIDVTKNRHVGSEGFVAVCDEELRLVTDNERNGDHISTIGITPSETMLSGGSATEICTDTVVNEATGFSESYIYVFTFVEGYCIIAAMPEAEAAFMREASMYTSVFMQVLIFATLFVFVYVLIKKVIINNLRKINNTLAEITDGNLEVTVDVRSTQEFASLSDDINSTVTTLKRYIAEAAARIDKELEYAKQIQLAALPSNFPKNDKYRICATMIAAKEIGGDFYDFYEIDENRFAFLVADVSGKGIPAAMFMMSAKTTIKNLAESGAPVNEIFTRANEKLCESNESGMFVTAWMGIVDLAEGILYYANAGHNPPLICRAGGEFEYLRARGGFILAGMEGTRYRVNEVKLTPGDRIFLYTDGVTEATDSNDALYGEERLADFLNSNRAMAGDELLPNLKSSIDAFAAEAPQFDDITMMIFDYKPGGQAEMITKNFPARDDALGEVIGFVEEFLEKCECPSKAVMAICVAIEEVFVNVAHYAYGGGDGDVSLGIAYDGAKRELTFRMADKGTPFDPLKKPDPDITLSAEERGIGGLGIYITKKTMDSVEYAYENGENVLTMKKNI